MVGARLVALHQATDASFQLPREGNVTIGRRATCSVACRDVAVSGVHCIITCSDVHGYEVEDRSTNGTFVNETRITKGQRMRLSDGDVISLTKLLTPEELVAEGKVPQRIQYRLELGHSTDSKRADPPPPVLMHRATPTAEGFAQDLLVQEQQSKAKITGELLLVRRRLDEERVRSEGLHRDLQKVFAALEDERTRCSAAQEARERHKAEAEQLRKERRELEELRPVHNDLRSRHDTAEVELGAQLQRAASLEAARDRLQADRERISGDGQRAAGQLAEAQSRLQQAQERAELAASKCEEEQRRAEAAERETERLQRELAVERSTREQLEDKEAFLHADRERADESAKVAKEALAAVAEQQAELESNIATSRADAESAGAATKLAQQQQEMEASQAEALRNAAARFCESLHSYLDDWGRSLQSDNTQLPGLSRVVMAPMVQAPRPQPAVTTPSIAFAAAAAPAASVAPADACTGRSAPAIGNGNPRSEEPPHELVAAENERKETQEDEGGPRAQGVAGDPPGASFAPAVAVPPAAPDAADAEQRHNMLSLMVGSQDSPPPPLSPPPQSPPVPMIKEPKEGAQGAKRSATESILVMPGLQPGFKRARNWVR